MYDGVTALGDNGRATDVINLDVYKVNSVSQNILVTILDRYGFDGPSLTGKKLGG